MSEVIPYLHSPIRLQGVVLGLKQHRNKFNFTFTCGHLNTCYCYGIHWLRNILYFTYLSPFTLELLAVCYMLRPFQPLNLITVIFGEGYKP